MHKQAGNQKIQETEEKGQNPFKCGKISPCSTLDNLVDGYKNIIP